MDKHLHIVCLDVPFPADYGGVFDLFYKIKALHQQGIKIHLHCFDYGRGKQDELKKYCMEVFYYQRRLGLAGFSLSLPYIVNSRRNNELLTNLLKDDYPVLLEGIHCTYYLYRNKLPGKKVFVRLHNIEFEYYKQLSKSATFFKKIYFLAESGLLKKYEKRISSKASFVSVSLKDVTIYEKEFKAKNIKYLPVFLPYTSVNSREGKGDYCLYHGNLSVAENEKAAIWLMQKVFNELSTPLIIAGKDPSKKLRRLVSENNKSISLIADPPEQEMIALINKAQVNVLPSFNSTGVKIKLLNAIFNGRHCVVNDQAIAGTGLKEVCHVAGDIRSFKKNITTLFYQPFVNADIVLREQLLAGVYNNEMNARQLIQWIW